MRPVQIMLPAWRMNVRYRSRIEGQRHDTLLSYYSQGRVMKPLVESIGEFPSYLVEPLLGTVHTKGTSTE